MHVGSLHRGGVWRCRLSNKQPRAKGRPDAGRPRRKPCFIFVAALDSRPRRLITWHVPDERRWWCRHLVQFVMERVVIAGWAGRRQCWVVASISGGGTLETWVGDACARAMNQHRSARALAVGLQTVQIDGWSEEGLDWFDHRAGGAWAMEETLWRGAGRYTGWSWKQQLPGAWRIAVTAWGCFCSGEARGAAVRVGVMGVGADPCSRVLGGTQIHM